jgi:alkanesulfonate monooxygenase SsuD/methylene tetrahydromethanopterin reductase-like flavin-dependent oxidoreductase (luciferase family)
MTPRELRPLGEALGTEVIGIDLSKPLDPETFAWIEDAFAGHPVLGKATAEGLIESGTALIGSPKTVLAGIERMRERTGFGILVALLQFGILSDELTRRNMDMFAAEVMPHLQG